MRRVCRVVLQLRLSSACSSSAAGPSHSTVRQRNRRGTVTVTMSPQDEKLIQRGEFYGVAPTMRRREEEIASPELSLSRMHEQLRRNYRVSAENVMIELVLKLESGDVSLLSLLRRSSDRWIPMSIRCCGRALSSIQMENRREIAKRLWSQIEKRELPISIESINALLKVKLENNEQWCPWETLKEIEEKRGLVPDQETFHLLLEKLSLTGSIDQCNKMMARRGNSPSDSIAHSHLVYANEVRGHNRKVDSMIEQASTKFGPEGEVLSLGAACVAAAAGQRMDRLRELLRRSVDEKLRLRIPIESIFEVIWVLSEKTADKTRNDQFMEEILSRSTHPHGFFRFLYREIERHISSSHFRSAMVLLQETMRVREALKNQERSAFADQMVGKMCRAMIRSGMKKEEIMEMANRMETTLHMRSRFIHDELMLAVLTMKESEADDRFASFSSLLPIVDPKKERPHLILPMLAVSPSANDRLSLLFRASNLGYSNLDTLDSTLMAEYLFQPMYKYQSYLNRQRNVGGGKTALEKMTGIIHSFGVPMASVWRMMYGWWSVKKEMERGMMVDMREMPHADHIQQWLRSEYASIFTDRPKETAPTLPLSKTRLDNAIEKGESSTVLSLLSSYGWPSDVDLSSTAPRILDLLLQSKESSANILKWMNALSRESSCRRERGVEETKSPLECSHLLKVINHRVKETRLPARELIEMVYELKRLFPHAVVNYNSSPLAIYETNKLISNCFIFKEGTQLTMDAVDDITELMRTLIKLDIVGLSQHGETVSIQCVHQVLQRFGWNGAVKLWLRFQSSFSFGNGILPLLSHSLFHKSHLTDVQSKKNIQYVLHKAHACLSPSRIHCLYAAMLVNTGKTEEAVDYFERHGSDMTPFDCALAFKLTNSLKIPMMDMNFIRTFPALCLSHTPLSEGKDEAMNMLHSSLRFCEMKRVGPLIVEMCDLFARYGVEPDKKEKRRVETAMEEHHKLIDEWIFSPLGLVQAKPSDDFIKEDEWKKYVRGMNKETENTAVSLS